MEERIKRREKEKHLTLLFNFYLIMQWRKAPYCRSCGYKSNITELICPQCNNLIAVDPIGDINRKQIKLDNIWSFSPFLPQFSHRISLHEGNTPVMKIINDSIIKNLKVKLEFRNPTGSFRDRASALIVSYAIDTKKKRIIAASTGSFSISLSAYAAKARIPITNFVPAHLDLSKIEQMKVYGSDVVSNTESLREATIQAINASKEEKEKDVLLVKAEDILVIEGQKTIGLELAYLYPELKSVIVPCGSGSLIYSIYRGYLDALESGWIKQLPNFYSVSLLRSDFDYFAESLKTKQPFLNDEVTKILSKTDGKEIRIDAEEMIDEALNLAKTEGLFIEPASASVIAAAKKIVREDGLNPKEMVSLLTGSGMNTLNVIASKLRGVKKAVWGLSESSTTKFEILNLIATKKATHGYAIWKALGKKQSLQSVYQHLNELENKNLISIEKSLQVKSKGRKQYDITAKGLETYEKMRELIDYV